MRIPRQYRRLESRQSTGSSRQGNKNTAFIIGAAVIVFVLASFVIIYVVLRTLRRRNCSPKLLPGKYLKRKWNKWTPGISYGQLSGGSSADRSESTSYNGAAGGGSVMNSNNIRRDTSIRSIITLPAYSMDPKATEQVIAREGERGGMDVVVEFPETVDQEEARREEQMEALYQIRLRRRLEIAAREERRRERREARTRGDLARLEELRRESVRMRTDSNESNPSAATLLAEHRSRGRQRGISSVSYADLGQVRHDGSRLRANSADSDQRPLLDSASAMSAEPRSSVSPSRANFHSREDSASSMISASTAGSDTDTLHRATSQNPVGGLFSEHDDGDVGVSQMPPPDYEHVDWGEAPPYDSPIAERRERPPQLAPIGTIPTIQVDVATPSTATPNTPASPIPREHEDIPGQTHDTPSGHS